jgi:hypothetical protein
MTVRPWQLLFRAVVAHDNGEIQRALHWGVNTVWLACIPHGVLHLHPYHLALVKDPRHSVHAGVRSTNGTKRQVYIILPL